MGRGVSNVFLIPKALAGSGSSLLFSQKKLAGFIGPI